MPVTEDQLLDGITDALMVGGWRWWHIRRSDRALTMGDPGFPDIIAVHPVRGVLALELKTETGRYRAGQREWLAALDGKRISARTVRPADYQALVDEVVGPRLVKRWKEPTP